VQQEVAQAHDRGFQEHPLPHSYYLSQKSYFILPPRQEGSQGLAMVEVYCI
jgi:hypothetical protein